MPRVWRDSGIGHGVEGVGNFLRHNGSPVPDRIMARAQRLRSGPETDRTMFFSDAVFAIAMTLLVLDLKLPDIDSNTTADELRSLLLDHVEPLTAFILSFILVGRLWMNHHRKFTAIQRYDGALQNINLAALFFVVFLPVPTAMLFQANVQSPWPPVLYALTISGSFASLSWLWAHAPSPWCTDGGSWQALPGRKRRPWRRLPKILRKSHRLKW